MRYRPEIDGLRALAVVPVIFYHAGFDAFAGGFVGVDVFFVISGYLITAILAQDILSNRYSLAKFYERRARRILPALLLVSLSCIPFAWKWMTPLEYQDFSQSLVAVVTFSSNIFFWSQTEYFAPAVELKPLLHTWSLAVEEQFYVIFPLLLFAALRSSIHAAVALVSVTGAASFALSVYGAYNMPSAAFYLIPFRAWELGVGALLALAPHRDERLRPAVTSLLSFSGLALIVYAIATFDHKTPFPGYHALAPVLGTALLIRFSGPADFVGRLMRLPPVVGIGLISYSLYLWHQPIFAFLRIRSLYDPPPSHFYGAIALTTVLAMMTWKFVETPFRKRDQISRRTLITAASLASILAASVGLAGHFMAGFPNATADRANVQAVEYRLRDNYGLSRTCKEEFTLSDDCRTGEAPELVVWGDSFAMHLIDGLLASKPDAELIQFTKSGCGPVLGLAPLDPAWPQDSTVNCMAFNNQVFEWLAANPGIKYAVLSTLVTRYHEADRRFFTDQGFRSADWDFAVERFVATLDALQDLGITPVLVSPPPRFGGSIGTCLRRAEFFGIDINQCDYPRSAYESAQADTIRFLEAVQKHHRVLWLDDLICASDRCATAFGDTLLYTDYGHFSHEGSAELGRRIGLYDRIVSGPHR